MKKVLFVCAVLALIVGFAAPAVQAQQCLKWVLFCDGVQVDSINGSSITASWYHYDCANTWPGMIGKIGVNPGNGCAGASAAAILARTADGSPVGDYTFVIDSLDGTIDMNQGLPGGLGCWIDELEYTFTMGACTGSFAPDSPQNIPSTR